MKPSVTSSPLHRPRRSAVVWTPPVSLGDQLGASEESARRASSATAEVEGDDSTEARASSATRTFQSSIYKARIVRRRPRRRARTAAPPAPARSRCLARGAARTASERSAPARFDGPRHRARLPAPVAQSPQHGRGRASRRSRAPDPRALRDAWSRSSATSRRQGRAAAPPEARRPCCRPPSARRLVGGGQGLHVVHLELGVRRGLEPRAAPSRRAARRAEIRGGAQSQIHAPRSRPGLAPARAHRSSSRRHGDRRHAGPRGAATPPLAAAMPEEKSTTSPPSSSPSACS